MDTLDALEEIRLDNKRRSKYTVDDLLVNLANKRKKEKDFDKSTKKLIHDIFLKKRIRIQQNESEEEKLQHQDEDFDEGDKSKMQQKSEEKTKVK